MVIETQNGLREVKALLDTGVGANFISTRLAKEFKITLLRVETPPVKTLNN